MMGKILTTHWNNLFIDIHTKHQQLSVLILSEDHFSHAKAIQEVLAAKINFNVILKLIINGNYQLIHYKI